MIRWILLPLFGAAAGAIVTLFVVNIIFGLENDMATRILAVCGALVGGLNPLLVNLVDLRRRMK